MSDARFAGRVVIVTGASSGIGAGLGSSGPFEEITDLSIFDRLMRVNYLGSGVAVTMIYPGFVFSEINTHALSPDGTPFGDRAYKRTSVETMETDECCRQILRAVGGRDRELVMTWRGKIGRMLKLIAPSLVDTIARRAIERRQ